MYKKFHGSSNQNEGLPSIFQKFQISQAYNNNNVKLIHYP